MDSKAWMEIVRKPYPSDVSDEEWSLIVPYLTLQREDAGQREHSLREVFNGLRYIVKTGAPWRWMPRTTCRPGLRSISRRSAGGGMLRSVGGRSARRAASGGRSHR